MLKPDRPLLVGLLFLLGLSGLARGAADTGVDFANYSHDEALAHSQAAIGNTLHDIELTRSDGSAVSISDYRGKPLVISMIFSSCHHVCPSTTQYLQQVVDKAQSVLGDDSFQVISVGFDTANDSPERMARFRTSIGISNQRWDFLAGDENSIAALTEQLGFIYYSSARGFDHLVQASVIDAEGRVYRQVYGMSFPTPALVEPLKQLVFGQPTAPSTVDYLSNRIRLFCTVYDPATDTYHIDISVFIGTFVGLMVSLLFGRVLIREWRRSIEASQ
ncbi:MAG: SCO family protein [Halieaceae bacterium]